jgi:hypothetical protein
LKYNCSDNSAERAYFENSEHTSTLKNLSCRKFSFPKPSQFSQKKSVLDASTSSTCGFPLVHTSFSSTLLDSPIWNRMSLCPPREHWLAVWIPFKN